jgi:cellulose biosynthesis protein BcsQ
MTRPYVITVSSEKGGVGKTTLATNLAVYLKTLSEDLPVTLLSFDNHFTVDRMFRLSAKQTEYHVGHLFKDVAATELIRQGEYGVQIIPSCHNLNDFNPQAPCDERFAEILSKVDLSGILVIDTCPILDPYTRNALYAADRVIVPIKDAPSLENCQHLANFFADHGISHSPLRLFPCLIDSRIRYSGPFRNSYQLLKAYAINRGYRCLEGFISKSPKVESLATNPEGKVYPILTHARSTEAHLQFSHLARQIYLEYLEKGAHRMREISEGQRAQAKNLAQREQERHQRLLGHCLCCGKHFEQHQLQKAFYAETSDRELCGFIEETCFYEMIFSDLYDEQKSVSSTATKELFRESAQRSYFLLQRQSPLKITLARLDEHGETLSQRVSEVKTTRGLLRRGTPFLHNLLEHALPRNEPQKLLLVRHNSGPSGQILSETPYARFQTVFSRARLDFESATKVEVSDPSNPIFP